MRKAVVAERRKLRDAHGMLFARSMQSIPALIRMKEIAGRAQDRIDIEYLRKLSDDAE